MRSSFMTRTELKRIIALGEDSNRQFKADVTNADSLAADLVAFSNTQGGIILIGVNDSGVISGLSPEEVRRINQLIGNAATQHIRSPIAPQTENIPVGGRRVVIVLTVPEGIDKPYFDRHGVIWLKTGADKRRLNSKEELRRLFQSADLLHADETPTNAGVDRLDRLRLRDFLRDVYKIDLPGSEPDLVRLLRNMSLAADDGNLSLAGVLLFAERPEWIRPAFVVKAVVYPGTDVDVSAYVDSEDFVGPLKKLFDDSLAFIMRNLHKIQAGQGVNAPGKPEIPPIVFEELLVNALIHRDYFISAPIRLFVFADRIEIVSPGHLPNNLTVERIRAGISNIRNPILASFVAKTMLPYRGLGSGIRRALDEWPDITFIDDRDGSMFTAVIYRKPLRAEPAVVESGTKSGPSRDQVRPEPGVGEDQAGLLRYLAEDKSIRQLMDYAGRRNRTKFRDQVLNPLTKAGLVEMTIPEKPRSSKQLYRLTRKGREKVGL
jgi:ATP-dependent DNA helicase RecG